ncbi:hypothetical protein Acr_06g0014740 [Actinidia rufa]|uniref:SWIB domain-containing protein n=1 Tax=Actinidia rufa TaxID=165716 RepID=A0A7J0ESS4_9ERIC|nr:hypothetical protein Acr_06g0014740 [Actinidia rufa]
MAISMVVFSSILAGEMATLSKSSSLSSLRFVVPSVPSSQVNLRAVTTASSKAAAAAAAAAATGKREPRGITKPRRVSPEMGAFLGGVSEIPRTQALKLIWAYIKQHDLQVLVSHYIFVRLFILDKSHQ